MSSKQFISDWALSRKLSNTANGCQFFSIWRLLLYTLMSDSEACWCWEPECPVQVFSGSLQLLLQCADLWGPHSFFCRVLPSEVFTASSAECYPLRSSQLLLQSATLWGLHSFFCSVLTSEVLTASSAVCYSLLSSQLFQQCAALWPCSEVRRGHSYRMCSSVWSATVTQSIWDVPWVCSVQFWGKRGMSALHSQGGRWGPRKVGSIQFWLWRLLSHTFLQLTINGQKYVYLSVIRSVFIFL